MKNIELLITGGSGFIGTHLVNSLNSIYNITNLGRNKNPKCSNIYWDLRTGLDNITNLHPHTVIHCASIVNSKSTDNYEYIDINVKSTIALLEFCVKNSVKKFIFISSGGVYGYSKESLSECNFCNPEGIYLLSKYFSEKICDLYKDKLDIVILRPFFPYGEGQKGRLISNLFYDILNNNVISLNKNGHPRINPIYISDLIAIINLAIENDVSGVFNACGDDIVSIEELCKIIAHVADNKSLRFSYKETDAEDLVGDNSYLCSALNYKLNTNLEQGLAYYFKWLKTLEN
ncbi:NAD-dependent epimerase/dehydratase family protein [Clostridium folliculivorans]|uniref:ADP-L-glycero-D-manno-heptose-6-epimerase n=1 Tax=Clostridium folliculivorans TaxID=2886038 RepID=A0A9W5Y3Q3_9CLOT|nr:NAD(P)-dependent oxidoreductase [Clostridium folliculivorans]GKU25987.1 ADP-L-glycero-D-manno-heptose-6-epimerase [Clostridium folliculivorans]GKU28073.1 ADP-L-glycero-D-manno-heptose-6-epimerase [Clostridium folliculivorans]